MPLFRALPVARLPLLPLWQDPGRFFETFRKICTTAFPPRSSSRRSTGGGACREGAHHCQAERSWTLHSARALSVSVSASVCRPWEYLERSSSLSQPLYAGLGKTCQNKKITRAFHVHVLVLSCLCRRTRPRLLHDTCPTSRQHPLYRSSSRWWSLLPLSPLP